MVLMMFNDTFALRIEDKIAIVQPNKEPLTFTYTKQPIQKSGMSFVPSAYIENGHLKPAPHDTELEKDALAFVKVLDDMYNKKLYRVKE
jgi:hypothetical protein